MRLLIVEDSANSKTVIYRGSSRAEATASAMDHDSLSPSPTHFRPDGELVRCRAHDSWTTCTRRSRRQAAETAAQSAESPLVPGHRLPWDPAVLSSSRMKCRSETEQRDADAAPPDSKSCIVTKCMSNLGSAERRSSHTYWAIEVRVKL